MEVETSVSTLSVAKEKGQKWCCPKTGVTPSSTSGYLYQFTTGCGLKKEDSWKLVPNLEYNQWHMFHSLFHGFLRFQSQSSLLPPLICENFIGLMQLQGAICGWSSPNKALSSFLWSSCLPGTSVSQNDAQKFRGNPWVNQQTPPFNGSKYTSKRVKWTKVDSVLVDRLWSLLMKEI